MTDDRSSVTGARAADFLNSLALATFAGGTLDISYACVVSYFRGRAPMAVLQSVASGWQGADAYQGGAMSALLGLLTHYGIMTAMVATFGIAAMRIAALIRKPWLSGPIYGLALYAVMYGIVLPLRFPEVFPRLNGWITVADIIVHMSVGLIIALVFSRARPPASR